MQGQMALLLPPWVNQWRSDVYQIYIRTARHKQGNDLDSANVRMSRGLQATLQPFGFAVWSFFGYCSS
jgi:hypothetical protein